MDDLPITAVTWNHLVAANRAAVSAGWAESGVFATGVGPKYGAKGIRRLLYVGKSAGPLSVAVGSNYDQRVSGAASTRWLEKRKNARSAFWQFIEQVDDTRQHISWSNVCKMDRIGGVRPPTESEWRQVADPCLAALREEFTHLAPDLVVFAISDTYRASITAFLGSLGYHQEILDFQDGWTHLYRTDHGSHAITTKHPQGWQREARDRVVQLIEQLMRR